jgi:hypothetical protein
MPPSSQTTTKVSFALVPKKAADDALQVALTSLAPVIHEFVKKIADTFIEAHSFLRTKEKTLAELNIPTSLPRSVRLGFKLQASPMQLQETAAFKALDAACNTYILEVKHQLKDYIKQLATLELNCATENRLTIFISAVVNITQMFFLERNGTHLSPSNLHSYCVYTLQQCQLEDGLLGGMILVENDYAAILSNRTGFTPVATTPVTTTPLATTLPTATTTTPSIAVDASYLAIYTVCISVLLRPCHAFDQTEHEQTKLVNIRTFATTVFSEAATTATLEILESEPSAAPDTIASIIDQSVSKSVDKSVDKSVSKSFQKLLQLFPFTSHQQNPNQNQKNYTRGVPPIDAPLKTNRTHQYN